MSVSLGNTSSPSLGKTEGGNFRVFHLLQSSSAQKPESVFPLSMAIN